MLKFVSLAVVILPLAACQAPGVNPAEVSAQSYVYCENLGLIPGTAPFARCRSHRREVAYSESAQRRYFLTGSYCRETPRGVRCDGN